MSGELRKGKLGEQLKFEADLLFLESQYWDNQFRRKHDKSSFSNVVDYGKGQWFCKEMVDFRNKKMKGSVKESIKRRCENIGVDFDEVFGKVKDENERI